MKPYKQAMIEHVLPSNEQATKTCNSLKIMNCTYTIIQPARKATNKFLLNYRCVWQ